MILDFAATRVVSTPLWGFDLIWSTRQESSLLPNLTTFSQHLLNHGFQFVSHFISAVHENVNTCHTHTHAHTHTYAHTHTHTTHTHTHTCTAYTCSLLVTALCNNKLFEGNNTFWEVYICIALLRGLQLDQVHRCQ